MKKFALLFACLMAFGSIWAQTHVKGNVVDETGEAAIGANITVPGTTTGTITDFDGNFEITVPAGKMLKVSYVGYKDQELAPKSVMKIKLVSDAQQIQEVVVTGMQVVDKRYNTGATVKVDADKLLSGVADASRALEGQSGVQVQNVSGTFGTAPKITVRGRTSIYGASRPLWVVDGVVMEDNIELGAEDLSSGDAETLIASAISGINADDIESFQILKDGSATSIYGARAMAGVIVVTTKKGQAGQSHLNYTGEFTYRMIPSYNDYNIANSQEQMGIYKELEDKGWLEIGSLRQSKNYGVYGKMYELIDNYDGNGYGLENTPSARNAYLRAAEFRNTDWFEELFNRNILQNHSVSFSTGTNKGKIYASLSVMNDPGWYKSSSVERYTSNLNASYEILPKQLTVSIATNGSYRHQKAPGTTSQQTDVVTGAVSREFDINPFSYSMNTSRTLDPDEYYRRNYCDFNIKDELRMNYIELRMTDVKFQGEIDYKPKQVKGLTIHGLAALRYMSNNQEYNVMDESNQARAYRAGIFPEDATIRNANSTYLYTDPDNTAALPETVLPVGGIYTITENRLISKDYRVTAAYNTDFNSDSKHVMNLFAGTEINSTDRQRVWFRGLGYQYDNGGVPFFDYNAFKQMQEENTAYYTNDFSYYRNLAFFGMGTYSYQGKYTINGTIRYEGSNKLGKSRTARWLPTWNVSAAWNAHEEDWFRPTFGDVLTNATLKASYSLTADRGPATNSAAIFTSYTPYRPIARVSETGIELYSIENSELTYEKKHEFNIGTGLGFLKNRINFEFDFYTRNNFDLIGYIQTSGVGGQILKVANVASMKSHGIEFTVSTRNIVHKERDKFQWNTDWIFSYAKNEITDLEARSRIYQLVSGTGYALQGYPVRALFSIPFAGLNEEGLPMFYTDADRTETTISGINFQDYSNLDYLKYEGPVDPTVTGSLGNNFSYKGFKLNVFLTYSFGNYLRLSPLFYVYSSDYSDLTASSKEMKNRWMVPGDEAKTNIPTIASKRQYHDITNLQYAYSAYNYSTERVAKGDFIRLKEVSLTYDFPKKWIQGEKGENAVVQNLSLKFAATNLWLIYADKKLNGQDPEFFNAGGVASPVPRQFTFTVRLGL